MSLTAVNKIVMRLANRKGRMRVGRNSLRRWKKEKDKKRKKEKEKKIGKKEKKRKKEKKEATRS